MRRIVMMALVGAAIAAAPTPSAASIQLVGTFSGNQCKTGDLSTCYAYYDGSTASITQGKKDSTPPPGSPGIFTTGNAGTFDDFTVTYNGDTNVLSFTYAPEAGDPSIHYFGIYQGGDTLSGVKNGYLLFYSSTAITSDSINLSDYFTNSGWSHIDFFDGGAGPIPEPATWAMMLLGFGGMGVALRRSRRRDRANLMQVA